MFIHSLIHPLIISRHYRIIKPHFNVCKKKKKKEKERVRKVPGLQLSNRICSKISSEPFRSKNPTVTLLF